MDIPRFSTVSANLNSEDLAAIVAAVGREFQREHPCPSTGQTSGACPGYSKDHIRALDCGGPGSVSNMQWQTTAEAKAKDKVGAEGLRSIAFPRASRRRRYLLSISRCD